MYYVPHRHEETFVLDRLPRGLAVVGSPCALAQQPAPPRPKVLAFFTVAGELDHWLFAQQAMRAFGARAGEGGYVFAATSDWDALNDANLRTCGW